MPHLSESGEFKGVLTRNSSYRRDCRGHLKGTGIYDQFAVILSAIQKRDRIIRHGATVGGLTQQQRVPGYFFDYTKNATTPTNFTAGYVPYSNQAHHVLPCEVFYDEKWTAQHLTVVLMSGYNINNPNNIIILPQCYGQTYKCDYHNLPDHSKGHNKYNERVVGECDSIFDLVDQALNEPDCEKEKDLRKQIYNKLKQIEKANFRFLRARGARPMK